MEGSSSVPTTDVLTEIEEEALLLWQRAITNGDHVCLTNRSRNWAELFEVWFEQDAFIVGETKIAFSTTQLEQAPYFVTANGMLALKNGRVERTTEVLEQYQRPKDGRIVFMHVMHFKKDVKY